MGAGVERTAAKVEGLLKGLGEGAFSKVDATTFLAKRGSAVLAVRVLPWERDEEDGIVSVEADVVEGATLGADILLQLLEFNNQNDFGSFGVDPDGVITFHHCLLGSTLSKADLIPVVAEVAKVADDWDDVIVDQAGGKTALDRLEEQVRKRQGPTIEAPVAQQQAAEEEPAEEEPAEAAEEQAAEAEAEG